mmetsp:Transcript_11192/g.26888  ORF Transcript_11192/g.26888 Transcript_11192/m.26888 type:complete len:234 (+) Transcript_11192:1247-1948(+)
MSRAFSRSLCSPSASSSPAVSSLISASFLRPISCPCLKCFCSCMTIARACLHSSYALCLSSIALRTALSSRSAAPFAKSASSCSSTSSAASACSRVNLSLSRWSLPSRLWFSTLVLHSTWSRISQLNEMVESSSLTTPMRSSSRRSLSAAVSPKAFVIPGTTLPAVELSAGVEGTEERSLCLGDGRCVRSEMLRERGNASAAGMKPNLPSWISCIWSALYASSLTTSSACSVS